MVSGMKQATARDLIPVATQSSCDHPISLDSVPLTLTAETQLCNNFPSGGVTGSHERWL
jgi:hypothetical protein